MTRRLLLPLLSALLLCLTRAGAADAPQPVFSSQESSYDDRTKELVGVGNAELIYGDTIITADDWRYNPVTRIVVFHGHAAFTKGARRLLANVITYHLNDGTYTVENVRMGEYPLYVTGTSATGDRTTLTVNDARVTVQEPGPFIPTLHADRIFYTPGQKLRAESANLGVGDVRPVIFGLFQQNLKEPLISYFSFMGGYRSSLGAYLETGLHLPVTAGLKLGGDLGIYTNRGVMVGPSGSYQGTTDGGDYQGHFRSGFIDDHGDRLTDVLGRPIPEDRAYVEWTHQQDITPDLTFTGVLNYWKDSDILRDFRPDEFFPVQQPDTFLESVYTGNNYFASLFARFEPNNFESVQQRLPELRFDLLPLALGNGFYERFNASVAVLRDNPVDGAGPDLSTDRLDAYYSLSRVFAPRDWLSFTPLVGGRLTYYDQAIGGHGTYTRVLGEVGFDAELRSSAIYDVKSEIWKIDGIRHLLTPRISYRYIPEADKGQAYIPPIDQQTFSTYLPPLGLGDVRNIDQLSATNTLRLELDNTFQTRDPGYGSRDLLVFNLANDFRFTRQPGQRTASVIQSQFAFMPTRWLQFDAFESVTPQTFTQQEFNTGLTVHDGDQWSVRFSSNLLHQQSLDQTPVVQPLVIQTLVGQPLDSYNLDAQYRINEAYEAVMRLQFDVLEHRFNEQTYGLRQKISNLWIAEYDITIYNGPRRESGFGFNVRLNVVKF